MFYSQNGVLIQPGKEKEFSLSVYWSMKNQIVFLWATITMTSSRFTIRPLKASFITTEDNNSPFDKLSRAQYIPISTTEKKQF